MNAKSDAQLLRDYAERGAEAAFTELVHRHTNLVYSAAWRQLESADLAAEITHRVFIGLARGARTLAPRLAAEASLAGWLCRSARNLSLNHRRDEFRRLTRERQAMEQLISLPAEAPNWDHLRRVLDDAIAELSETDYDALVLRFFQNQDFRAVGAALGTSDDTAQKRVARALEKLREHLAQRGVQTSAAALSVVISANAVQAAPAGLATAISAAALLSGGAVSTSTIIATTKTLAMTTLQKTFVTAALAALTGAGIYQARQAAQLRGQNLMLQQSQAPLAEQIERLQSERAEATNRLANVLAENLRLKFDTNQTELLKLRGEVGLLRQQLSTVKSELNSPSIGFAKMLSDPTMRNYILQTQVNMIRVNFKDLFKELKLTPEQTQQAIQVMGDLFAKNADALYALPKGILNPDQIAKASDDRWAELKVQMLPLLGEGGTARLKLYMEEMPAHATVDLLNGRLGANQLTDEQNNRLIQLVKAEPFGLTRGISGDWDPAFWSSQPDIDEHLFQITESNQRIVQKAVSFLTPDQLAELTSVLSNGVTERIAQAAAMIRKQ